MFYGKTVRYTENGKEFDAVVYQEHKLLISHLGAGDQPLVHVVFADPAKENLNLSDPRDKFIVRLDVAHASLEFTDEEKKRSGKEEFEGGRWSEEGTSPLAIWDKVREDRAKRVAAAAKVADAGKAEAQSLADVQAQIAELEGKKALDDAKKKLAALQGEGGSVQ